MAKTSKAFREEFALPGTHSLVLKTIKRELETSHEKCILDFGAGYGSLSKRLQAYGFHVQACDIRPELFQVENIECLKVDANGRTPYKSESFDLVVAVELLEHIDAHLSFFAEVHRLLKKGGKFVFTTPNILSLKSRMSFLFTGFFYSFKPLAAIPCDPVRQHISPFPLFRYLFGLQCSGFRLVALNTDKYQRSSILLCWLIPFIRLITWLKFGANETAQIQNSSVALFGRKLVIVAEKEP